jgi:hypothetical protein|tara:strand:+ start:456 stop:731 length:276 start_codon:yes stop_codon:yes gene_type:complete
MFAIPQRIFRQLWVFLAVLFFASTGMAEEGAMSRQQQCAEYGVYQDASENWVDCLEETYTEEAYVEEPYVEEPYVEETYVEEPYVEETYTE